MGLYPGARSSSIWGSKVGPDLRGPTTLQGAVWIVRQSWRPWCAELFTLPQPTSPTLKPRWDLWVGKLKILSLSITEMEFSPTEGKTVTSIMGGKAQSTVEPLSQKHKHFSSCLANKQWKADRNFWLEFKSFYAFTPVNSCGRRLYVFRISIRPIVINVISQEHLERISLKQKYLLGLQDDLILIWWSKVRVTMTLANTII